MIKQILLFIETLFMEFDRKSESMRADDPYYNGFVPDYWNDLEVYNGPKEMSISMLDDLAVDYTESHQCIPVYADEINDDLAQ